MVACRCTASCFCQRVSPRRRNTRPSSSATAAVTELEHRLLLKRTNLNNVHEIADFRAAVSFLQGEPGVDPARIGVWGTGVSGAHVIALAATDARVKAGVAVAPVTADQDAERQSFSPTTAQRADLVRLARTGQAPSTTAAATAMNADETRLAIAEYRPFTLLDQIPKTSAILQITDQQGDAALDAAVQWFLKHL